jgi:hypothetical protein
MKQGRGRMDGWQKHNQHEPLTTIAARATSSTARTLSSTAHATYSTASSAAHAASITAHATYSNHLSSSTGHHHH